MDAVNDVSRVLDVTSVHHTSAYSDTTVGTASWNAALLAPTSGSGSGTFVVDANTALHNVVLHFNVASLLTLGGLTVNWTISQGAPPCGPDRSAAGCCWGQCGYRCDRSGS